MTEEEKKTMIHELKVKMLSRMVHLFPEPRDEEGNIIPTFRMKDGSLTSDWDKVDWD